MNLEVGFRFFIIFSILMIIECRKTREQNNFPNLYYKHANNGAAVEYKEVPPAGELMSTSQVLSNQTGEQFAFIPHTDTDTQSLWKDRYNQSQCQTTFSIEANIVTVKTKLTTPQLYSCMVNVEGHNEFQLLDTGTSGNVSDIGNITLYTNYTQGVIVVIVDCSIPNCFPIPESFWAPLFNKEHTTLDDPMLFYVSDPIEIKAHITVCLTVPKNEKRENWRMFQVLNNSVTVVSLSANNIADPVDGFLIINSHILDAGLYVIFVEIRCVEEGSLVLIQQEDYIYVRVMLPEIVTQIKGPSLFTVPLKTTVTIDGTPSYDPTYQNYDPLPPEVTWQIVVGNDSSSADLNNCFLSDDLSTCAALYPGNRTYFQTRGSGLFLQVTSNQFKNYIPASEPFYVFVILTMSRDTRITSAIQVLHISPIDNTPALNFVCIYNCYKNRLNKYSIDKIGFELSLHTNEPYTYVWTITEYMSGTTYSEDDMFDDNSGLLSASAFITKNALLAGGQYMFSANVYVDSSPSQQADMLLYVNVNTPPYGGGCTINNYTGIASSDVFYITCQGWLDDGERISKDPTLDVDPKLKYLVAQRTIDPILLTVTETILAVECSNIMSVVLKLGDPSDSYLTTLVVKVIDEYGDSADVEFSVTSTPAFNVDIIEADYGSANTIERYMRMVSDALDSADVDMDISIAIAVAGHLNKIPVPEKNTDIPKTIDSEPGLLLDINLNEVVNASDIPTFDMFYNSLFNYTIDPTTFAIQQGIQKLTTRMYSVFNARRAQRGSDQFYLTMMTQCFTNLVQVPEYVNENTKDKVVQVMNILSDASTNLWTTDADANSGSTSQTTEAESQLVDLTGSTIDLVVPKDVGQLRPVFGIEESYQQIQDMVRLSGENMSQAVEDAEISPKERAYIYLKSQAQLQAEVNASKQGAKTLAKAILDVTQTIMTTTELCEKCSVTLGTEDIIQTLNLLDVDTIVNSTFTTSTTALKFNQLASEGNASVPVSITHFKTNIFIYDKDFTSSYVKYGVTHAEIGSISGTIDDVNYEQVVTSVPPVLIHPVINEDDESKFSYHQFIYRSAIDDVCLNVEPYNNTCSYAVYIRFDDVPTVTTYDTMVTITKYDDWIKCIPALTMTGQTGLMYIGIQQNDDVTTTSTTPTTTTATSNTTSNTTVFTSPTTATTPVTTTTISTTTTTSSNDSATVAGAPYYFALVTTACMNWEENIKKWRSDKCQVTWLPKQQKVNCLCNNLKQVTFGTSFFVAPNAIDFSSVFLKFSLEEQAAVLATLVVILAVYVVALVLVRRQDHQDLIRWGVLPLTDNIVTDTSSYMIQVFTGMRYASGTSSKVAFVLSGDKRDTGVRELQDGVRDSFETGSVMQFLLTTYGHLGMLTRMRIWHDSSGSGELSSWYLSKVVVHDLKHNETYTFIAERWIAVENTTASTMDCTLTAATGNTTQSFNYAFSSHAKTRFCEGHMLASVVYRPTFSNFTRAQRVTVALMYVMVNMIVNAMYFNPQGTTDNSAVFQLGPFRFSLQQLYVSVISALITTPSTLLVILIFQYSRRRVPWQETGHLKSEDYKKTGCCRCTTWCQKITRVEDYYDVPVFYTGQEKTCCVLPGFCAYIGWFIALATVVVSSFFVMLYGMEWGKEKSEDWLTSFIMSLLESFLLLDPVIIVSFAFVLALITKVTKDTVKFTNIINEPTEAFVSPAFSGQMPAEPLQDTKLEDAQIKRQTEKRRKTAILDIIFNIIFLWIIVSISYSNRSDRSFNLHENVLDMVTLNSSGNDAYLSISSAKDFYIWLNSTAIPALFPTTYYNGDDLHWTMREYMTGMTSYRLGPPRLRQFRIYPERCDIPYIKDEKECYASYSSSIEDNAPSCIGWQDQPCSNYNNISEFTASAWQYKPAAIEHMFLPIYGQIGTYSGNGFIADLDINEIISKATLQELYDNIWIDRRTRAVLFEFTLFCANVNLFVYATFLTEFPATGGAVASYSVQPLRVYQHIGSYGTYVMICEAVALVYILFLAVKLGFALFNDRCGSFKKFWFLLDLSQFLLSIATVVSYYIRQDIASSTISKFQADKNTFVDFNIVSFWDQLVITMLACIVFFATIRVLKVLEGNKTIYLISSVFSKMASSIIWIGVMFVYILVTFATVGYILFGDKIASFMNVYKSSATLFISLLGKSRFTEMDDTDPILAKIYFFLFVTIGNFFMFSLILSALCQCINEVTRDTYIMRAEDIFMETARKIISKVKPSSKVDHPFQNTVTPIHQRSLW